MRPLAGDVATFMKTIYENEYLQEYSLLYERLFSLTLQCLILKDNNNKTRILEQSMLLGQHAFISNMTLFTYSNCPR